MSDGVERDCTRIAVIAGDKYHIGMALDHTCGDGADVELGNELGMDTCLRVDRLRIVDQLFQILDEVDVVMRRRGDRPRTQGGVTDLGDSRRDLGSGQMVILTGLSPLGELDLQAGGVHEVVGSHAEAGGCDLLDAAIALRIINTVVGFAVFIGIGACTNRVHDDGEHLVCFPRDGAVAYGIGGEAFDDFGSRLDFSDANGLAVGAELHQAT